MGRSEWGFPIISQQNLDDVRAVMRAHNTAPPAEVGEELTLGGVLRYQNQLYLYLMNQGGRDYTERFIRSHYPGTVLWPFDKPVWWRECNDYVWQAKSKEDQVPSFAELQASGLLDLMETEN
jgi:hypothetical protein